MLQLVCIVVFVVFLTPLQVASIHRERNGNVCGEWDALLFPFLHFWALLGMIPPVILAFELKMPVGFVLAAMYVLLFAGTAVIASISCDGGATIMRRTLRACRYPLVGLFFITCPAVPLAVPWLKHPLWFIIVGGSGLLLYYFLGFLAWIDSIRR